MYIFDGGQPTALAVLSPATTIAEGDGITYTWYVDGIAQAPSAESDLLIPTYLGLGNHRVRFTLNYRGQVYSSNEVTFMRCEGAARPYGPAFLWENNCCAPSRLIPLYSVFNPEASGLNTAIANQWWYFAGNLLPQNLSTSTSRGASLAGYAYPASTEGCVEGTAPIFGFSYYTQSVNRPASTRVLMHTGTVIGVNSVSGFASGAATNINDRVLPGKTYTKTIYGRIWTLVTGPVIAYVKTTAAPSHLEIISGMNSTNLEYGPVVSDSRRTLDDLYNLGYLFNKQGDAFSYKALMGDASAFPAIPWRFSGKYTITAATPAFYGRKAELKAEFEYTNSISPGPSFVSAWKYAGTAKFKFNPFGFSEGQVNTPTLRGYIFSGDYYRIHADLSLATLDAIFELGGGYTKTSTVSPSNPGEWTYNVPIELTGTGRVDFNVIKANLVVQKAKYNYGFLPPNWEEHRVLAEMTLGFTGLFSVGGGIGTCGQRINGKNEHYFYAGTLGCTIRGDAFAKAKLNGFMPNTNFEYKVFATVSKTFNADLSNGNQPPSIPGVPSAATFIKTGD